jgi:hypothetical protein
MRPALKVKYTPQDLGLAVNQGSGDGGRLAGFNVHNVLDQNRSISLQDDRAWRQTSGSWEPCGVIPREWSQSRPVHQAVPYS